MKRYSEFINFPIKLWASKEVDVEVPADEDESTDEEETRMNILYMLLKSQQNKCVHILSKIKCGLITLCCFLVIVSVNS